MRYTSPTDPPRDGAERIGILLVNSGTPRAPTARAVRAFLAPFLADPRVVELPRALWLPLLYGVILPWRPARVARKCRLIWTAAGSPLADLSERLRNELAAALAQRVLAPLSVELGMLYSDPGVPAALRRLRDAGARCRTCTSSPTTTTIPATSRRCARASAHTGRCTGVAGTC